MRLDCTLRILNGEQKEKYKSATVALERDGLCHSDNTDPPDDQEISLYVITKGSERCWKLLKNIYEILEEGESRVVIRLYSPEITFSISGDPSEIRNCYLLVLSIKNFTYNTMYTKAELGLCLTLPCSLRIRAEISTSHFNCF